MAKLREPRARAGRAARATGPRPVPPLPAGEPVWYTAITRVQPNEILVRGYPLDELMGRLTFGECVYLILRGELPSPTIGKLFTAALVASIDHGVTPPSTLAARNVATTRREAARRRRVRASWDSGCTTAATSRAACGSCRTAWRRCAKAPRSPARPRAWSARRSRPAGGRPASVTASTRRTRAPRGCCRWRTSSSSTASTSRWSARSSGWRRPGRRAAEQPWPLNLDGAIAAVCGDLGFEPELGNALFLIARIPGLVAHANEERSRQKPMRQIDPRHAVYDGPPPRRLPETRK